MTRYHNNDERREEQTMCKFKSAIVTRQGDVNVRRMVAGRVVAVSGSAKIDYVSDSAKIENDKRTK